jgi:hypothetical protein
MILYLVANGLISICPLELHEDKGEARNVITNDSGHHSLLTHFMPTGDLMTHLIPLYDLRFMKRNATNTPH